MADYIVKIKSKKEEKVVRAFLSSMAIDFYTDAEEEAAFYKAMQNDRKTPLLSTNEKQNFIKQLKSAKWKLKSTVLL